jgi:hypothetical protein
MDGERFGLGSGVCPCGRGERRSPQARVERHSTFQRLPLGLCGLPQGVPARPAARSVRTWRAIWSETPTDLDCCRWREGAMTTTNPHAPPPERPYSADNCRPLAQLCPLQASARARALGSVRFGKGVSRSFGSPGVRHV